MSRPARRGRDVAVAAGAGAMVGCLALLAALLVFPDRPSHAAGPGPAPSAAVSARDTPGQPEVSGPLPLPPSAQVAAVVLEIPAIGVRTPLERLQLDAHGVLQPPADPAHAGWFAAGPVPGDPGPAVIAGHLDSRTGPAVFLRLSQLRAGDLIVVRRSDGGVAQFRVQSTHRYAKAAFPTEAVYGPTPVATLRLITCGGAYDHAAHRYPDDVVVFAEVI